MALILCIDVSGNEGLVLLAENGVEQDVISNREPMQHAAFLQPAIHELLSRNNRNLNELDAIAVSNGPGSYTGLRVGLASAKGLCYALDIPLLTLNSLQLVAFAASMSPGLTEDPLGDVLFCPMIDARRQEVFFGLYDKKNETKIAPTNAILSPDFLANELDKSPIMFTGSGISKWKLICNHPNAVFAENISLGKAFARFATRDFEKELFADLRMADPFYCKDFYQAK